MVMKVGQYEHLNAYDWFHEPNNSSIKLRSEFLNQLFKEAFRKENSMSKLSEKTNLSKQTLFNNSSGKSMCVGSLKVLLAFTGIKYQDVCGNVCEIAENKITLPLKLDSVEGAVVLAAILGDGSNTSRVMYKNKDEFLLDKVNRSAKKLLGDVKIDRRISSKNIPYLLFPRILGRILEFAGVPAGKQTLLDPKVPCIILQSNKVIKARFIQQFFDDEGWVETDQMKIAASQCVDATNYLPISFKKSFREGDVIYLNSIPSEIKHNLKAPNLLIDLRRTLKEDFNIESNIRFKRLLVRREHITGAFELEIQKKSSVRRFVEMINFSSPVKKEKAEFMMMRKVVFPRNIMLLIINEAIRLFKEKGYFLAHEVASSLGFPQPPIRKRIMTLVRTGIFRKKNEKYYINLKL